MPGRSAARWPCATTADDAGVDSTHDPAAGGVSGGSSSHGRGRRADSPRGLRPDAADFVRTAEAGAHRPGLLQRTRESRRVVRVRLPARPDGNQRPDGRLARVLDDDHRSSRTKRLLHDPDDSDPRVERPGSDAKLSADGFDRCGSERQRPPQGRRGRARNNAGDPDRGAVAGRQGSSPPPPIPTHSSSFGKGGRLARSPPRWPLRWPTQARPGRLSSHRNRPRSVCRA